MTLYISSKVTMKGDYVIEDDKGIAYSYMCQGDKTETRKEC